MIIKTPSKRVSHLNLKFLNLKIMSIQQQPLAYTTPINQQLYSEVNETRKLTEIQKQSKIISHFKKLSQFQDYTNDVTTTDHYHGQTIISSQNVELKDLNTDSILKYLNADCKSIQKDVRNNYKRISKHQNSKQMKVKNQQMQKYQQQLKDLEKENKLIHQQIVKTHSMNLSKLQNSVQDKNIRVKNIKKMRLLQNVIEERREKNSSLEQHYNQMSQDFKYLSQDTKINQLNKQFFNKFKNNQDRIVQGIKKKNKKTSQTLRQQRQSDKQLKHLILSKNNSRGSNSSKSSCNIHCKSDYDLHLPNLIRNKYENFYEDLYKEKTAKSSLIANKIDEQSIQQLKKRLINNNYDKNLQIFLISKRKRVPEFIKKLR